MTVANSTHIPPKVFISYSHDSAAQENQNLLLVFTLAALLRQRGIDCSIDQYEVSPGKEWVQNEICTADFVLVVCTERYHDHFPGKGEFDDGAYYQDHRKYIPVLLNSANVEFIPKNLMGLTYYSLDSDYGYELLYRRLTNQPLITTMPALPSVKMLPPRDQANTVHLAGSDSSNRKFQDWGEQKTNLPTEKSKETSNTADRLAVMIVGGIALGSAIAQLPGAFVGGLIAAGYGFYINFIKTRTSE